MHTFTDNLGRTWEIAIHVTAIKRCRAYVNIDLLKLVDNGFEGFKNLLGDSVALVELVYTLCRDEAIKREISDEDFGQGMWGDALGRVTEAFTAEYIDFFQDARVRAGLTKLIEKSRDVQTRMIELGLTEVEAIDPEQLAKTLRRSFGASPESSESTPDHLPSANST